MKYLTSSVTIGACLLLSSAGNVFAGNPHPPGVNGPLGTGGALIAGCGGAVNGPAPNTQPGPLGQQGNMNTHSPFPTSPAGPNTPNAGSTYNINSQYDNACLRQQLH